MYGNLGYGFNPFGTILMIVIWVVIIWVIISLIRGPRRFRMMNHRRWGQQDALDILRERYAKGEINKEEFEEKKAVLLKDQDTL